MKKLKNKFKHIIKNLFNNIKYNKYYKISSKNINGIAADVIRLTHSIEKGLTLQNVKLGYGHEKQKEIISMISIIEDEESCYCKEAIKMAVNAINQYIEYHKIKKYSDDYFSELEKFVDIHRSYLEPNYGGTKNLRREELQFNEEEINHFFNTRHSIRDFAQKPIDEELIRKAIELAQTAPSACNRQAYRCYVIDKSKADNLKMWLSRVGVFADKLDKIILVTGKTSAYRYNENYQYVVSASIFAAYLSLTLHLYGIGSCVIQRPVVWTKGWDNIRKEYKIDNDEQIVVCLGIGMLKENTTVPISHRININEICKFIK